MTLFSEQTTALLAEKNNDHYTPSKSQSLRTPKQTCNFRQSLASFASGVGKYFCKFKYYTNYSITKKCKQLDVQKVNRKLILSSKLDHLLEQKFVAFNLLFVFQ